MTLLLGEGLTETVHPGQARQRPLHEFSLTESPGKECGNNKLLPTRRKWEMSKGKRRLQSMCPINLPEFFLEFTLVE